MPRVFNLDGLPDLEFLASYVAERDSPGGWIDQVSKVHGITERFPGCQKDAVKDLFIRLTFGGSYDAWITDVLGRDAVKEPKHLGMEKVASELLMLRKSVKASASLGKFFQSILTAKLKQKPAAAAERSAFALVLQSIEASVLGVILRSLKIDGWKAMTLIYDGTLVLHREGQDLNVALRNAENAVELETGFKVTLLEKSHFRNHGAEIQLKRAQP